MTKMSKEGSCRVYEHIAATDWPLKASGPVDLS